VRPSVEELIESCRHSLREVIVPDLSDEWAKYVARAMDRVLDHLAVRWELEGKLLAEDSAELRALFPELEAAVAGSAPLRPAAAELSAASAEPALGAPISVSALAEENERLRSSLRRFVEALDASGDAEAPAHGLVLRYLRREVDRESRLAKPVFMHFGPRAGS